MADKKKDKSEEEKFDNNSLPRKYRPQNFEEIFGNEITVKSLKTLLKRRHGFPTAFLFHGPRGCGKTTLGRLVAQEMGCGGIDFKEFNMANTRGIDTVRQVDRSARLAPLDGDIKVYFFDEAHMLTGVAEEGLLKLLEEPPKHCLFILCTTEPQKLLPTTKSRCTDFKVSLLDPILIKELLKWVCEEEGVEIDGNAIKKIASSCGGSPREALIILDKVIDIEDKNELLETIDHISLNEDKIIDLCRLMSKREKSKWPEVAKIITVLLDEHEPESIRYAILGYMASVLLKKKDDARLAGIMDYFFDSYRERGRAGLVFSCYMSCQDFE